MKTKQILYIFWSALTALVMFGMTSCDDDAIIRGDESGNLPYIFRPAVFKATNVGSTTTVDLTWASVEGASYYTLEIYKDSLEFNPDNFVLRDTTTHLTYSVELAGATRYSARIKANAEDSSRDSEWNGSITFRTPSENLFNGYTTLMTTQSTVTANWLKGSNVTHLLFTNQDGVKLDPITIDGEAKASGTLICTGLDNATYTVEIYNNDIVRGKTTVKVEGDVFLTDGQDLKSAMDNAAAGSIIVLSDGVYPISSGTYRFDRNIKVMGMNANTKATLCMKDGASASASMFGFVEGTSFGSVQFENLDITGYVENISGGSKIGYLFNNNIPFTLSQGILFKNCSIHNLANTPFRLQSDKNQWVENLEFNGCIIYDVGFGSVYAIVNVNTATDIINNITFKNSTIYNFKGGFILRQKGTISSISIENCTINEGMMDSGVRYLIDLNTIGNTPTVSISNCILGETSSTAGGIRPISDDYSVSGCYYTSDYSDDALVGGASSSIKAKMKAYTGASTDLWTNPAEGDFTFKDATFAGKAASGDPRWR